MSDTVQIAKDLKEISKIAGEFKTAINKACGGSLEWSVDQMVDSYLSMYERFCPYQIGDIVELVEDYDTSDAPGWDHCKHFLIKGAIATVRHRGYNNGRFTFDIEFVDESWLKDGVPQPVINKHVFGFSENSIKRHVSERD